eukprot:scaffold73259_cov28-Prasinocladus_malaysianus.AAC.1
MVTLNSTGGTGRLLWTGDTLGGSWGRCFPADNEDAVLAQRLQLDASDLWLWVGRDPPGRISSMVGGLRGTWSLLPLPPPSRPRRSEDRASLQSQSSRKSQSAHYSSQSTAPPSSLADSQAMWESGSLDVKFHNSDGQGTWVTVVRASAASANRLRKRAARGRPVLAVAVWSRSLRGGLPTTDHKPTEEEDIFDSDWQVAWLPLPDETGTHRSRPVTRSGQQTQKPPSSATTVLARVIAPLKIGLMIRQIYVEYLGLPLFRSMVYYDDKLNGQ